MSQGLPRRAESSRWGRGEAASFLGSGLLVAVVVACLAVMISTQQIDAMTTLFLPRNKAGLLAAGSASQPAGAR